MKGRPQRGTLTSQRSSAVRGEMTGLRKKQCTSLAPESSSPQMTRRQAFTHLRKIEQGMHDMSMALPRKECVWD